MTPPDTGGRLLAWEPPDVEALGALRTGRTGRAPSRAPSPAQVVAAALLLAPLTVALAATLPPGVAPTPAGWALLLLAGAGAAATSATYLPRHWPPVARRPSSPCALGALVLLATGWMMAGVATSTAGLVPVAAAMLGALAQRLLTAAACTPRA